MNILVTAGPTREFLDPVRYLSNRSTGKMGYAVARQAVRRGHSTRMVSGPVALAAPEGVEVVQAVSAADMLAAVRSHVEWCRALIMVAAVADWRPAACSLHKLKKDCMSSCLTLERTPDILSALSPLKGDRCFVGFAAETENLESSAKAKLSAKKLDMIVANDVGRTDSGFETDVNQVQWWTADGGTEALPLLDKDDVAQRILNWVETRSIAARRPE